MLRYNNHTGEYVVLSDDVDKAERVGLTLSLRVRGPAGERVWFTDSPYAALSYWDEADGSARAILQRSYDDLQASKALDSSYYPPCPDDREFAPFQRAGIRYSVDRPRSLNGDQPGTGKTAQSIGVANATGAERILAVVPAAVRTQWAKEVLGWSTMRRPVIQTVKSSKEVVGSVPNWVVTSYDLARREDVHRQLCSQNWDMLILDEAHYLKSIDAARTRAVFGGGRDRFRFEYLADKAERVLGLTGTPLPNRPRECYTLARGLCWESVDYMSYDDFCARYNPSRQMDTGFILETRGRLPELQHRLRCNFMVRRMKKDVLKDLPPKVYQLSYVETDGRIKDVVAKEKLLDFDVSDLVNPTAEIFGQISTIRREMGEAMAPRVAEYVVYLLDEYPKLVLFAHHRSVVEYFVKVLADYNAVHLYGNMTPRQKDRAKEDFMTNPEVRVFVGQLDAAGTGLDGLQGVASRAVIAEPSWVPGGNEQVVDRLHRMGQLDNVIADLMVVEGSFSERVLASNFNKVQTTHTVLDEDHVR